MEETVDTKDLSVVLNQIVENVFQTMMDMQVRAAEVIWPPDGELITAAVSLAGAWKGAVIVECGLQEAFLFTAKMIGGEQPTALNDDVRDALGELANMVGGNLKSVLPSGVALSLPTVIWGRSYSMQICRAITSQRFVFDGVEAKFSVVLVEVD